VNYRPTFGIRNLILENCDVGDDILQMIVCLRDGKEAVEHLKERYPEEANNGRRAGHQD
jgi:hypothetical protein